MKQKTSNRSLNSRALTSGLFFVLAQLFVRGVTFLLTPVYTRLVSTAQYGQIRIYESWLLIAVPVMSLCLYKSIPRAKFDFPDSFNGYVSSTQTLSLGSSVAMFLFIAIFFGRKFMSFTGMDRLMFIYLLLYAAAQTALYFYQYREKQLMRFKQSTLLTVCTMLPAALLSIGLLWWGNKTGRQESLVDLRVIGFYTPQIVGGIIAALLICRDGGRCFDRGCVKYSLLYSIPLIPEVLSIRIMNQADKIMVSRMTGSVNAGIFALGTTVSFIIWIVEDAVWNAWLPWMYEKLGRGEGDDVEKPWISMAVIFGFISWALVALSPELILFLGGRSYEDAKYLAAPMMAGILFRFYSYCYTAIQNYHRKTAFVAAGTIGVMLVNVILNYICIKSFGYQAAAYTTAASYLLLMVVQGVLEKKVTGERIVNLRKMLFISLFFLAADMLTMLTYDLNIVLRYIMIILLSGAFGIYALPTAKSLMKQISLKKASSE